jgi:hypothetical protein
MGSEFRGTKLYYYRKRREGDRVISEYIGKYPSAQLFAQADRLEREERLAIKRMWQDKKYEFEEIAPDYELLTLLIRDLVRATLLISDYHPHKGEWRKKHHDKSHHEIYAKCEKSKTLVSDR